MEWSYTVQIVLIVCAIMAAYIMNDVIMQFVLLQLTIILLHVYALLCSDVTGNQQITK